MKLLKKINKLIWIFEDLTWLLFRHFLTNNRKNQNNTFTIGITTFMDRYHNCLIPLVKKLTVLFPNYQIIVIANGHVKKAEQLIYLESIKEFCNKFPNVELISHIEPRGLSFLWNQIIKHSNNEKILILNDDVKVKHNFSKWICNIGIINTDIALLNYSWSHFFISKKIIHTIGWFDEGLLEIGGEDDDYSARLAINNIQLHNFKTRTIAGKLKLRHKRLTVNSYGKNMHEESYGYSSINSSYLSKKWQMSNDPFEGATVVSGRMMKYWKLRNSDEVNNKSIKV